MKLGLLTDIHEQVEFLRIALDHFRREQVDQIVVIGDVIGMGDRIEETCRLLTEASAIGVWGNHDYGICTSEPDVTRSSFSATTIGFMTSLLPRLELNGCYFTHVEPWLDPEDIADLWFFDGPPEANERLDLIFNAKPHRLMFAGHYHKWLLATPDGIADWAGECKIRLNNGRYFVVVGGLLYGQYAIFDTETSELVPYECSLIV